MSDNIHRINHRKQTSLKNLLQNTKVVSFVQFVVKNSYQEYFNGHEEEIGKMVDKAWRLLVETEGKNEFQLNQTVIKINNTLFKNHMANYWFNTMNKKYKLDIRPLKDFEIIHQDIKGKKILDFGSGGGYLALVMSKNGYDVTTMDVLDYRINDAKDLPFKKMSTPHDIEYPDDYFDTVIIKGVLHHINAKDLPIVLKKLNKIAKRLLIKEDTYALPTDMDHLKELIKLQPALKRFMELNHSNQLQAIMLIDYFANTVVQGILNMNYPNEYKTIPQWRTVLNDNNFNLKEVKLLGFQKGNVTKTNHIWLIVDKIG